MWCIQPIKTIPSAGCNHASRSPRVRLLCFWLGGTRRKEINKEQGSGGFPAVSLLDAEPTWQGRREGGPRGEPKASSEVDGQSKSKGNKIDIQTTVQDGQLYMLYRKPKYRVRNMKQILLPTGARRGNWNRCVTMKREQGHMIQGCASRRRSTGNEDKWNENETGMKRSWNGAATHVTTCPTLGVTMPRAPYANSHWAGWLSEAGPRRVPD
jgi:hypothetical protein